MLSYLNVWDLWRIFAYRCDFKCKIYFKMLKFDGEFDIRDHKEKNTFMQH